MDTLSFDHVYMNSRTAKSAGKFKIASGGVGWKEASTGLVTTIPKEDLERLEWMRAMRGSQLRILLKSGMLHKFDGFPTEAVRDLEQFAREHWSLALETPELAVKGHNWGRIEVEEGRLKFLVGDRMAFDLGLKEATNVVQSGKDEVAIEFGAGSEAERRLDSLAEIRFFVPGAPRKEVDELDEADAEEEEGKEDEVEEVMDRAESLFTQIKAATDLDAITGEMFAELQDLPCVVPRGRYGLEMSGKFLRLHGKSYDYKILYSQLAKVFMVPKADEQHVLLVLHVDPPIRQGQTRYPFIVFQFDRDEVMDVQLKNLSEVQLQAEYGGRLQMSYESTPTFELVSTLFRVLAGQKVLVPGGSYKGPSGASCMRCALKATEGALYPLERNILFLPKPPTLLPHADIVNVEFSRIGSGMGNPRSFDVKISLRSGATHAFSNAPKEDYHAFEDYCRQKEIPFTRLEEPSAVSRRRPADEGDDLGLARKRTALDVDEDESDDEDYVEGEESDSSLAASGSDEDEDYGSGEEDDEEFGSGEEEEDDDE